MGRARRAAVAKMCSEAGRTLRLQFPIEDLGFTYPVRGAGGSSVWQCGAGGVNSRGNAMSSSSHGVVSGPSAALHPPGLLVVGGRLPHVWLMLRTAHPSAATTEVVVSSLDLTELCPMDAFRDAVASTGGQSGGVGAAVDGYASAAAAATAAVLGERMSGVVFTVVAPLGDDGGTRVNNRVAALRREAPEGVSIRLVLMALSPMSSTSDSGDKEWRSQSQLCMVVEDCFGTWAQAAGGQDTAVLVRPDGHVAWMGSVAGEDVDASDELLDSLRRSLGWD